MAFARFLAHRSIATGKTPPSAYLDFSNCQLVDYLDFVDSQIQSVIETKIQDALVSTAAEYTRRSVSLPKVKGKAMCVIGMRRAGKTTFLHQCRADLRAEGVAAEQLIYFNFEDERLAGLVAANLSLITDAHARMHPPAAAKQTTWFFDEIQLIPGWESFTRRLLDEGRCSIFISGSSAKLLSREIATSMRGRGWEVVIYPFSFEEFLTHHQRVVPAPPDRLTRRQATSLDHAFALYLMGGGFPEAQGMNLVERLELVSDYVDVVLLRDVIERHGITNIVALRQLLRRLMGSPAGLFSVQKFFADMKSQHIAVSRETIHTMLAALEDTFLLHTVAVATDSEKRRNVNPRKAYPVDPALIHAFDRSGRANTGHALESAVLIELMRRKHEVAYVRTSSGYEVDFLARSRTHRELLIQVCVSLDDPAVLTREVRAIQEAMTEHPRAKPLLLTLQSRLPQPSVPPPIQILPAWQWMLTPDEA